MNICESYAKRNDRNTDAVARFDSRVVDMHNAVWSIFAVVEPNDSERLNKQEPVYRQI